DAEDAVAEMLQNHFEKPATSYRNFETGVATITTYLTKKPAWDRAARAELAGKIQRIGDFGLEIGPGRCSLARVRRQDWAESWKRHFKPIEIGSVLLVKPSWSRRRARKGQSIVVLDPGLSFGTGQHPTTSFCLQQLVVHRKHGELQSFL